MPYLNHNQQYEPDTMLFVIEAKNLKTGSVDAILFVLDDRSVVTDIDGKIGPGFDGPFFNPSYQVGNQLAMKLYNGSSSCPTPDQLLKSGILTAADIADAMPSYVPNYELTKKPA